MIATKTATARPTFSDAAPSCPAEANGDAAHTTASATKTATARPTVSGAPVLRLLARIGVGRARVRRGCIAHEGVHLLLGLARCLGHRWLLLTRGPTTMAKMKRCRQKRRVASDCELRSIKSRGTHGQGEREKRIAAKRNGGRAKQTAQNEGEQGAASARLRTVHGFSCLSARRR